MGKGFIGWVIFIGVAIMLVLLLNKNNTTYASIPLSEFTQRFEDGRVKQVAVGSDELFGQFASVEIIGGDKIGKFRVALPTGTTGNWVFTKWMVDNRHGAQVDVENNPNLLMNVLIPLVPWLLIFAFIWFFVFRQLRRQKGQGAEPMRVYVVNLPGGENAPPAEAP